MLPCQAPTLTPRKLPLPAEPLSGPILIASISPNAGPIETMFCDTLHPSRNVSGAFSRMMLSPFRISLWKCNAKGSAVQPNKDGYAFWGGGGPGCIHANEDTYWAQSDCRKGL